MNLLNIDQGSAEWLQARCGSVGASDISDLLSKGKGGAESTGCANLRARIVCERLTGCVAETFKNAYMERGNIDEGSAKECYSFITGNDVEDVGLIMHPFIPFTHASPDGVIGSDGLVEIKRKIPAIHIEYIFKNRVPPEYVKQMMWQLACTGRQWNDFCSYCPELPENMQLFIVRLERDEAAITEMEKCVIAFNQSVERMISDLRSIRP